MLDFAATFGTIAIARAYADWSTPVNASYRGQLIDRAVDLVQLFPLSATKNGADIRLSVDAVEDMFRIDDLTHIVIVAGDSDYVALAQKAKRLGRYVVGIGVAGGTSRALTASCDEYADYDALLDDGCRGRGGRGRRRRAGSGIRPRGTEGETRHRGGGKAKATDAAAPAPDAAAPASRTPPPMPPSACAASGSARRTAPPAVSFSDGTAEAPIAGTRNPGRLLLKALELLRAKNDEEWQPSGAVKNQMLRMDPSFQERRLGFGSFSDFVKSRGGVVELDEAGNRIRIRPKKG